MILHSFDEIIVPYNIAFKEARTFDKKKPVRIFDDFTSQVFFHAFNSYFNLDVCVMLEATKITAETFFKDVLKKNYEFYGLHKITMCSELFGRVLRQIYWRRELPTVKIIYGKTYSATILFLRKMNMNFKPSHDDNLIFFPQSEYEISTILPIFLCPHTLQFLSDILHYEKFPKSMERFNLYCTWMFENFSHLEREKFIVFSSNILQLMGLRESNDIDIIVGDILSEEAREKALTQRKKWTHIADILINGTSTWPDHWDVWTQTWAEASGANNFMELFNLEKYHIYYHGVKVTGFAFDIARRKWRNSMPRRVADLIAIKLILNRPDITFPIEVKKYTSEFVMLDKLSDRQIQKLREKNHKIVNSNKLELINKICERKFLETVRWALEDSRYHFKLGLEYISSLIKFVD